MGGSALRVILVGGHESAGATELGRFLDADLRTAVATPAGRPLERAVASALAEGSTTVVVPMTFGRNPTMVADAAKTLKWIAAKNPGRVALAEAFGQPDHLTAWLRTAANRVGRRHPGSALLIVSAHSNPFDEAELHRLAYLVAANGALSEVHVAIADDSAEVAAATARLRLLGIDRIAVIPAGFDAAAPAAEDAESAGPLMSDAAVARVVADRVRAAVRALAAGDDGIDAGLLADHGHGYAHSHAFENASAPATADASGSAHRHADGTIHSHRHARADVRIPTFGGQPVSVGAHDHHD